MTKSFNKFKKCCIWPIMVHFPKFWGKKNKPRKSGSNTTSYGFLAPSQNLEKTNDTIPRKHPNRRKNGRTDRPYFIGPFWLLLGVQQGHDRT